MASSDSTHRDPALATQLYIGQWERHLDHRFWNGNDREISIRYLADSDVPTRVNIVNFLKLNNK